VKYKVYVLPRAWKEIKQLPGNIRQRVKRAIDRLGDDPRPPRSVKLDTSRLPEIEAELRRLRIERWRIVYAITERELYVDVWQYASDRRMITAIWSSCWKNCNDVGLWQAAASPPAKAGAECRGSSGLGAVVVQSPPLPLSQTWWGAQGEG